MTPNSNNHVSDWIVLLLSSMSAVIVRLIKAAEKPSKSVVIGELILGLVFCFILAPAVQEYFALSLKAVCAITWAGAYFSGLVLKGMENIIKGYIDKITPKIKDEEKG